MKIKTKLRLDIILAIILTLGGLTVNPYFTYSKLIEGHERSYFMEPSIFLLYIFIGILWGGVVSLFILRYCN